MTDTLPGRRDMDSTTPRAVAIRVTKAQARQAFNAGARVLVSEYGHETTRPVYASTTTHDNARTTWSELVALVDMWRNRYPRQRYYVVVTCGTPDGVHSDDVTHVYRGQVTPSFMCGFHASQLGY